MRCVRLLVIGSIAVVVSATGCGLAGAASPSSITAAIVGAGTGSDTAWTASGSVLGVNPTSGSFTLSDTMFTGCSSGGCQALNVYTLTLRDQSGDSLTAQSEDTVSSGVDDVEVVVPPNSITLVVTSTNGAWAGFMGHVVTMNGLLASNAVVAVAMVVTVSSS